VDATFASAQKGAMLLALPSRQGHQGSSLSPLVTVSLLPYLPKALRLPSASLWRRFLPGASSTNSRRS
jgi:hypothetical protein